MWQGIYRGTTPSITLNITGVDLSDASVWPTVIVTVENGRSTFDVTRDNLTIAKTEAGSSVTLTLTQHQTLLMHNHTVSVIGEPIYDGPYDATPTVDGLTLATKRKSMSKDVTIEPIPIVSVSNASGGRTVTIG